MTSVEQWGALIFISIVMLVYLLAFIALVQNRAFKFQIKISINKK